MNLRPAAFLVVTASAIIATAVAGEHDDVTVDKRYPGKMLLFDSNSLP